MRLQNMSNVLIFYIKQNHFSNIWTSIAETHGTSWEVIPKNCFSFVSKVISMSPVWYFSADFSGYCERSYIPFWIKRNKNAYEKGFKNCSLYFLLKAYDSVGLNKINFPKNKMSGICSFGVCRYVCVLYKNEYNNRNRLKNWVLMYRILYTFLDDIF